MWAAIWGFEVGLIAGATGLLALIVPRALGALRCHPFGLAAVPIVSKARCVLPTLFRTMTQDVGVCGCNFVLLEGSGQRAWCASLHQDMAVGHVADAWATMRAVRFSWERAQLSVVRCAC